ncbi:ROK family protein [Nocardioides insulae]|uniref:ROK family protein n=1 Tax=Nocardioides insulae TaxID=394734 RepID=UPI0003FDF378|nr:ROK family protein [Nocardioides insulae]
MTTTAVSSAPSPQDAFIYGRLINLVRTGQAVTRPELERETGLGRKVIAQRVRQAMEVGLLENGEMAPSQGGRPSRTLTLRNEAGHAYSAVIGATEMSAAVTTLDGTLVDFAHQDWESADRADETLERLDAMFSRLAQRTRTRPWAFGIGVAGPVDFSAGALVAPPIMPGWNGFNVRSWFRERYDAPVWVDNDVNVMALGEWHRGTPSDGRDLLYILVDLGIGAGLVSGGSVFRGHHGAAGDIGHIQVTDDPAVLCRCGRTGCLEAVSGGWGLVQRLLPEASASPALSAVLKQGRSLTPQDVGLAAAAGDPLASSAVEESLDAVARTVATLVSFANPGTVVLGGGALRIGPEIVDRFARTLVERTSDLAGSDLVVRSASLDFREGVIGAALLAIEQLFNPAAVGLWIEEGTPVGRAAMLHRAAIASTTRPPRTA